MNNVTALNLVKVYCDNSKEYDFYEFGVYSGHGLRDAVSVLVNQDGLNIRKFLGFDSFVGLPPEDKNVACSKDWFEGQFNAVSFHGVTSIDEAIAKVKAAVPISEDRLEFIVGYYSETLTSELAKSYKPAAYVHMDVDMYTSCVDCLKFLTENNLWINGTIIRYDDWYG